MTFDELLKHPQDYVKDTAFQVGQIYQIRDDREQARMDHLRYIKILRINEYGIEFRYLTLGRDAPREDDHFQPRSFFAGLLRYIAPHYDAFLRLQAM